MNSGRLIALAVEETYLQQANDFQPIERAAIGNAEKIWKFAWFAQQLIFKWHNRRSQRRSDTWTSFGAAWERWKMPSPSIVEKPWPSAGQALPRLL